MDQSQRFLDNMETLADDGALRFACHPGVPCFNACCSNLDLMLTPYDALRLCQGLDMDSKDLIQTRTTPQPAPDTGLPILKLNMLDDKARSCPYVRDQGCSVYPHRPSSCRTYPLGRASRVGDDGGMEVQFFVIRESHCKGFAEDKDWTPATWLEDQGLVEYNRMNDRFTRMITRFQQAGARLNPQQMGMALLALYQPDEMAGFIDKINLFERIAVPDERRDKIVSDPVERLGFGMDWLELMFLGRTDKLTPRQG